METDTKVYLLLELAEKGDLLEYINGREVVPEDEARRLFCHLASAMAYCHSNNVIHRDIKCENLLVDAYGNLKVTDFGFAAYTDKSRLMETFCGSYAYCCPEILRGEPYNGMMGDVWSMGVVLYALVCSRLPFSDDDLRILVRGQQVKPKLKFVKTVGKSCRDLVKRMLAIDKKKRYTAENVLQHPWLRDEFEKLNVAHKALTPSKSGAQAFAPPSAPVLPDYQEECYPLAAQPIHPKKSNTDPKLAKCVTSVDSKKPAGFELGKTRRNTIGSDNDLSLIPSRKVSLRDELLRNLADKEMKSRSTESLLAKVAKKPSTNVEVEMQHRSNSRRRSSLVTDIKKAEAEISSAKAAATRRKSSLVSDVVKVRSETETEQKSTKTPGRLPHTEYKARKSSLKDQPEGIIVDRVSSMAQAQLKCAQEEREKELEHLKFSMAGKAARASANERSAATKKDSMAEEAMLQLKLQKVVIMGKMDKWRGKCQKMMGYKRPVLNDRHSPTLNRNTTLAQPSISHYY